MSGHGLDVLHLLFGGLGGQAAVVRDLVVEGAARGLRSGVCTYAPASEPSTEVVGDLQAVAAFHLRRRDHRDSFVLPQLVRIFAEERPRALIWHSAYGSLTVRRAIRRGWVRAAVLAEHTPPDVRTAGADLRSVLALGVARGLVTLSPTYLDGKPLLRFAARRRGPVAVVPNGVDAEIFHPDPMRARVAPGTLRIGMVARLVASKDVETLIDAVQLLHDGRPDLDVHLTVAGDGDRRAALEARAVAAGLRDQIMFTGMLDREVLAAVLRGLDVYVQATLAETHSTAVLQAYATGLPVVGSDVSGLRGFVRHGEDGVLVPPKDPGALAAALASLADDPARRRRLGDAARERVLRDHTPSQMLDGYLRVLAAIDPDGPWGAALAG